MRELFGSQCDLFVTHVACLLASEQLQFGHRWRAGAKTCFATEGQRVCANFVESSQTRILAGPYCTQILGDLGADVIKIEHPFKGDDTRQFAPPFLKDEGGRKTSESVYFLAANRNKKSVGIDFTTPAGQTLVRRLIAKSDVVVENFKTGSLKRYGLSYNDVKDDNPSLVYCSITGFGQTGP